jgi:hypothetical protein
MEATNTTQKAAASFLRRKFRKNGKLDKVAGYKALEVLYPSIDNTRDREYVIYLASLSGK